MVDLAFIPYAMMIAGAAVIFRVPFLNLPIDEDFAFYTYRAHFARKGIKWKKDVFTFIPQWRMHILDTVYGNNGTNGILRIRLLLALFHAASSVLVAYGVLLFSGNTFAALAGGMLFAFFGTAPAIYSHSFNQEQLYLPVLLLAFYLLINGNSLSAGMLLALSCILKYSCAAYIPPAILAVAWYYGRDETLLFIIAGSIPLLLSFTADLLLGYIDSESLRGLKARFALGIQLPSVKKGAINIAKDFSTVVSRTLPLWLYGLPALILSLSGKNGIWIAAFAVTTIIIFVLQKFFSRYHYIPIVAMLCIATGGAVDYLMQVENSISSILLLTLFIATIDTAFRQRSFYLQPTSAKTLSQYKKFDQFIYLPHLGKIIKRLIRIRKESGRMFVWGNFTQLYFYAGLPASDQFVHYAVGPWDSPAKTVYFDTVVGGIIKHRPIYIVKAFHNLDMELLENITGLKYRLLKVVLSRFPVYRLESVENKNADPVSLPWQEKAVLMERLCAVGEPSPGIERSDMLKGKYARAIKETRKLCRLNRYDLHGKLYLAELLGQTDKKLEAETILKTMMEEHQGFPGPRLALASQKMELGEYETAEDLIEKEINAHGQGAETKSLAGMLNFKRKAYREAVNDFENALSLSPESTAFLMPLAESYACLKLKEKALGTFTAILKKKGCYFESVDTKAVLGIAKLGSEKMNEIETIKFYLARDKKNETLKYALASRIEKSGKSMEAQQIFRELVKETLDDKLRGAVSFRLACREEDKEKQKSLLEKCLKLLPLHEAAKEMLQKLKEKSA